MGKVPLMLGYSVEGAEVQGGKVQLRLRAQDGTERKIVADHVIAATGYKVDLDRLSFLSSDIRSKIKAVNRTPVLSLDFESSVPGPLFRGSRRREQLWSGHALCVWCGFQRAHHRAGPIEIFVAELFAKLPISDERGEMNRSSHG